VHAQHVAPIHNAGDGLGAGADDHPAALRRGDVARVHGDGVQKLYLVGAGLVNDERLDLVAGAADGLDGVGDKGGGQSVAVPEDDDAEALFPEGAEAGDAGIDGDTELAPHLDGESMEGTEVVGVGRGKQRPHGGQAGLAWGGDRVRPSGTGS
jgi:hypothetical protein